MSFTRKQAQALLDFGRIDPRIRAVYEDARHPDNARVRKWAERLAQIVAAPGGDPKAAEAPFDPETFILRYATGDAEAVRRFDSVLAGDAAPPPLAAPLPGDDALAELRNLTPDQARQQIDRITRDREFGELMTARDPLAIAGYDFLIERAASRGDMPASPAPSPAAPLAPAAASNQGPSSGAPMIAAPGTAKARFAALGKAMADPSHPANNASDPNHATARAEFNAAFEAAIAEGG